MRVETLKNVPAGMISCPDKRSLFSEVERRLKKPEGFSLATLNLDHIVKLRRDPMFRAAYDAQDLVVADGNPIVWLCRLAGKPVELIPGSELVIPLAEIAARNEVAVALLGSREEVLAVAARELEAKCPGLPIVAQIAPAMGYDPDGDEAASHLATIASTDAGLCFLALGAPKQELLAARGRKLAPDVGFVSIGAGLDFLSGHQRRAPTWVQKLALEWLWRAGSDPRRLMGRYVACAMILPRLVRDARVARRKGRTI